MNCLRSLEHFDREFESHSRHGCLRLRLFSVCVVLYVGSGLATGWSLVQEVLPSVCSIMKLKSGQGTTKGCRATNEWNKFGHYLIINRITCCFICRCIQSPWHERVWGSRGKAPHNIMLSSSWRRTVAFSLQCGKEPSTNWLGDTTILNSPRH
jgi:hypothetical protein